MVHLDMNIINKIIGRKPIMDKIEDLEPIILVNYQDSNFKVGEITTGWVVGNDTYTWYHNHDNSTYLDKHIPNTWRIIYNDFKDDETFVSSMGYVVRGSRRYMDEKLPNYHFEEIQVVTANNLKLEERTYKYVPGFDYDESTSRY